MSDDIHESVEQLSAILGTLKEMGIPPEKVEQIASHRSRLMRPL